MSEVVFGWGYAVHRGQDDTLVDYKHVRVAVGNIFSFIQIRHGPLMSVFIY